MTSDPYPALVMCARRRFLEWELTRRELRVLELLLEMSFVCGQLWACIPRLALLAEACCLDRADASKTLTRLIGKGAVRKQQHAGETLYKLELFCAAVPARSARSVIHTPESSETAREELRKIQRRRLNGTADASGQMRFEGRVAVETAEDLAAPEEALRAMLEDTETGRHGDGEREDVAKTGESVSERPGFVSREPLSADLPDDEFTRLLEEEARKAAEENKSEPAGMPALPGVTLDRIESCRRGLDERFLILFDALHREFKRGGSRAEAEFRQYAPAWRSRLLTDAYALREAVSDHQQRVGGPADKPGAWMLSRYNVYSTKGAVKT